MPSIQRKEEKKMNQPMTRTERSTISRELDENRKNITILKKRGTEINDKI